MSEQIETLSRVDADNAVVTAPEPVKRSVWTMLSFRRIGVLYTWAGIVVLFAVLSPDKFWARATAQTILDNYAITGLFAISLVIPLSAGVFDLSVGYLAGLAGAVAAWLIGNTAWPPEAVVVATIVTAIALGLVNAFAIVGLRVQSLIATVATGAIFLSLTLAVSGEKIMVTRVGELSELLARPKLLGVTLPVIFLLVAVLLIGVVMERTPFGRFLYALGFEEDTTRLAGVSTTGLKVVAILCGSALAGFAGLMLVARAGASAPSAGPSYLLPAFAAAFLGATQFRPGRFNPWGTVVAVFMIGTGTVGLNILGAPIWAPQLFVGIALLVSVSLTGYERR